MNVRCILSAALAASLTHSSFASVRYVNASAPPGGDGSSWSTAFRTIQQGATVGGEVWVAKGTYAEKVTISAPTALYGGFAGSEASLDARNVAANPTIIDAGSTGSAVTITAGAPGTRIDGFTITKGTGTTDQGSHPTDRCGGGIFSLANGVILSQNVIRANAAMVGGGVYAEGTGLEIHDNSITGNGWTAGAYSAGVLGGGLYLKGSATISRNIVTGNSAIGKMFIIEGVGKSWYAGGGFGGGVCCEATGPTLISNNVISGNSALGGNLGAAGGGMTAGASGTTLRIVNNTFADDWAAYDYLYLEGERGHVDTSAVTLSQDASGVVVFANNVIAYSANGVELTEVTTTSHNCLYGLAGYKYSPDRTGPGDVLADPLLTGRLIGDYHIAADSPCRDSGDDTLVVSGETDADGNPRLHGPHVDIGAYELQLPYHLAFIVQPDLAAAGQPFMTQPVIGVLNEQGDIMSGATGSVTLSVAQGSGASGAALSGNATVGISGGLAQFTGLSIDKVGTNYLLQAVSTGLSPAYSAPFGVAGTPHHVAFTTQPGSASLGTPLSPQPVVTVQDANNTRVPNVTGSVTLALSGGPSGVSITGTATLPLVQGVASFTDLQVTRPWSGYTLSATASLTSPVSTLRVTSAPLNIYAPRVYVSKDGNDANDGTSWQMARATVQPAVVEASPDGGEVWVAKGTYNGNVTLLSGRKLYGGFAGSETALSQRYVRQNVSVLKASAGSVVTVEPGATLSTVLDGFTLTGGTGTLDPDLPPSFQVFYGGGIYCLNASPTIMRNVIAGNTLPGYGGEWGSAIYCGGGTSTPLIAFNTILGNATDKAVTATTVDTGDSLAILSNNLIINNTNGVRCRNGTVENNTIVGNGPAASSTNAVLYCGPTARVRNNIVAFNDGPVDPGDSTFRNNDVFGNRLGDYTGTDLTGLNGNIKVDPLFVDRAGSNYHLATGSPGINAGDSSVIPAGSTDFDGQPRIMGPAVDMGAFEFPGTIPYTAGDAAAVLRIAGGIWGLPGTAAARLNVVTESPIRADLLDAAAIMRKVTGLEPNP